VLAGVDDDLQRMHQASGETRNGGINMNARRDLVSYLLSF
jgi:hypothetical protein